VILLVIVRIRQWFCGLVEGDLLAATLDDAKLFPGAGTPADRKQGGSSDRREVAELRRDPDKLMVTLPASPARFVAVLKIMPG
jgi:hypothetical protein